MFADDVLLYHIISSPDDYLDAQHSITAIEHWSSQNHLQLNALKCKCMTTSRKKTPHCPLILNDTNLEDPTQTSYSKAVGDCYSIKSIDTIRYEAYVMNKSTSMSIETSQNIAYHRTSDMTRPHQYNYYNELNLFSDA